ncbi:hypothetical protein QYF36_002965 [Acer negundo]|nr:hypothetical protein QYF36_002965 [Acer negundo]
MKSWLREALRQLNQLTHKFRNEENVVLSINDELIEEVPSGAVQVVLEENTSASVPSLPKTGECRVENNDSLKRTLPVSLDPKPSFDSYMGLKSDRVRLDKPKVLDLDPKTVGNRKYGVRRINSNCFRDLGISEVRSAERYGKRKGNLREECGKVVSKKSRKSDEVCDEKEGCGVVETNRSQEANESLLVYESDVDFTRYVVSSAADEAGVSADRSSPARRSR